MTQKIPVLGAHMSIAKGFLEAAHEAVEELGANALQLFLKSPRGRGITKLTPQVAADYISYVDSIGPFFSVAHASYLLNFAKPLGHDPWPLTSLVADLRSMEMLKGDGVVLHVGKTLELPYEVAEDHLVENLKRVLDETSDLSQPILLENTAGQGTEMGTTFEQLQSLYERLDKHPRLKFCLDTCHLFAAGYDLRTKDDVESILQKFDQLIGLDKVALFHFNDSLKDLNSRVDRHQNLEMGFIGSGGLKALAQFGVKHSIPMILETPLKTRTHLDDLTILRSWI
jgi:deoxyribonuclease IV